MLYLGIVVKSRYGRLACERENLKKGPRDLSFGTTQSLLRHVFVWVCNRQFVYLCIDYRLFVGHLSPLVVVVQPIFLTILFDLASTDGPELH